jgi:hypothetical protein
MVSKIIATFVVGLLMATSAVARDLSYTFVRLDYVNTEIDVGPVDVDGDGFDLQGSLGVAKKFYIFGGYQDVGLDFDIDASQLELGGGWHHGFSSMTDFVATLSYIDAEIDVPGAGSFDEDGFGLSAGVRHLFTNNFEFSGRVNYVDLDDSDTSLEFRGDYFLMDHWVIGAGLEFGGDVTTWLIGGRYNFGGSGK